MNSPSSSESGNVHGMPLAALLGREPAELAHFAGDAPAVLPKHTVLVGIRNLDERREGDRARVEGARLHDEGDRSPRHRRGDGARDRDRRPAAPAAFTSRSISTRAIPTVAPGVGTPVKGGLSYREAHVVMEMVAESGRLTSLDLVEVNPTLDIRNTTAELGTELALSALGKSIL